LKSNGVSALYYAILSGVSYAVLSSLWSGYIFMLILLSSYVAVLMFLNRINTSVYRAFTVFYLTGTGLSLLLPSVFGFRGPFYLEQFPGIAVFVLLQIPHYAPNLRGLITPIGGVASIVFVGAAVLGILSPSKGFSIFLYQLTSAQGSNWVTFFRDLHLILFLFPAGVVFLFRKRNDVNLFFILYALLALLLSSVSTHFTPVLYPVASVLGSLALTATLRSYLRYQDTPVKKRAAGKPVPKEIAFAVLAGVAAILGLFIIYSFSAATHPTVFRPVTTQPIVSQTTNQVKLMDDLREAHTWLRHNTPASSKILSWKGQGQHLAAFARSSILGADLENPQNLDKVSKALQSDEATAAQIMKELGADYLLVIFGGSTGYNDDLNRLHEITPDGQFNPTDSVLFKLSYKGFAEQYTRHQAQPGFDLLRRQQISYRPTLSHFDEVFTSEHWIVRIYKLRENVDSGKQEAEGNWQE
jgi:dolichyl-diphosphooligosaccharide--protein glycosyltransferase